jgi:hypothetical protein
MARRTYTEAERRQVLADVPTLGVKPIDRRTALGGRVGLAVPHTGEPTQGLDHSQLDIQVVGHQSAQVQDHLGALVHLAIWMNPRQNPISDRALLGRHPWPLALQRAHDEVGSRLLTDQPGQVLNQFGPTLRGRQGHDSRIGLRGLGRCRELARIVGCVVAGATRRQSDNRPKQELAVQ